MGRFAAKFRGFWMVRGCGEAIQRTADATGRSGRKIKKGVENQKFGVLQRDKSCQSSKEVTLLHPITIRTFTGILEEIEKPTTLHRYPASHLRNS